MCKWVYAPLRLMPIMRTAITQDLWRVYGGLTQD